MRCDEYRIQEKWFRRITVFNGLQALLKYVAVEKAI